MADENTQPNAQEQEREQRRAERRAEREREAQPTAQADAQADAATQEQEDRHREAVRSDADREAEEDENTPKAPAFTATRDNLFEVVVDQWGYAPAFERGFLLTREMADMYDVDWALTQGVIRRAPEYAGRNMRSTLEQVTI